MNSPGSPPYPPPVPVRLRDLAEVAKDAAAKETEGNVSKLIRRALRAYLDGATRPAPELATLAAELRQLRLDLARVGGNLNQLAHAFAMDDHGEIDDDALAVTHAELRAEFRRLSDLMRRIENGLKPRE